MSTLQFILKDYQLNDYPDLIQLWQEVGFNTPGRGDNINVIERTILLGGKLFLLQD